MDANINSEGFQLVEVTLNTDSYRANQHTQAGYLMSELLLGWDNEWMGASDLKSPHTPIDLSALRLGQRGKGLTGDNRLASRNGADLSRFGEYEFEWDTVAP